MTVLLLPQLADELRNPHYSLLVLASNAVFKRSFLALEQDSSVDNAPWGHTSAFKAFQKKVAYLAIVKTNMNGEIEQPVKVLPTRGKLQCIRTGSFSGLVQANGILNWREFNGYKRPFKYWEATQKERK